MTQTHVANYCKLRTWENARGPTPMYVDPRETISALYSQGNELLVCGQNAGKTMGSNEFL